MKSCERDVAAVIGAFVALAVTVAAVCLVSPWLLPVLAAGGAVLGWVERERRINERVEERLALAGGNQKIDMPSSVPSPAGQEGRG